MSPQWKEGVDFNSVGLFPIERKVFDIFQFYAGSSSYLYNIETYLTFGMFYESLSNAIS